ncbi:MAG: PEGA domain-containing protein [Deltaproteobacteria bacterium]|nr:PEGA domain-containing protein [Deltaproteobacteria bacterium]
MGTGKGDSPDDRTILDPLNADELKALKEARERLKGAAKAAGVAAPAKKPATKVDEELGSAPTMAMPAVPNLGVMPQPKPLTPDSARIKAPEQSSEADTLSPQNRPVIGQGGGAGKGGFGDNTLMWMAPVEAPAEQSIIPARGAAAAGGMTPTALPKETAGRKAAVFGLAAALVIALGAVVYTFTGSRAQGTVELVTTPLGAAVKIDGNEISLKTPMKATLPAGKHQVEIALPGFKTETITVDVPEGKEVREARDMFPISDAGKMTVSIAIAPMAANITVDAQTFGSKRSVMVPNLDPQQKHTISVSAGGYKKIDLEVAPGELKESYNFQLQKEEEPPPQ